MKISFSNVSTTFTESIIHKYIRDHPFYFTYLDINLVEIPLIEHEDFKRNVSDLNKRYIEILNINEHE